LIAIMAILTFRSPSVPGTAKLGLIILLGFIGSLVVVVIVALGPGVGYQRVFEYSSI